MGRCSPPKSGPTGKNGNFWQFFKIFKFDMMHWTSSTNILANFDCCLVRLGYNAKSLRFTGQEMGIGSLQSYVKLP